jgi:lysophospholipase L1-like esterase
MKNSFALVFVVLLLNACSNKENALISNIDHTQPDSTLKEGVSYLALGDSYTIGHAVEYDQRWPVQLVDSLRKKGINMADPEIIAQTGWTTTELRQAIEIQDPLGPYHLVTLLIGVNNQYRGLDTATYRQEFRELLQMAVSFADEDLSRVIVVSIPDYSVTPFAQNKDSEKIAREIDDFNYINFTESKIAGVKYVDITPISRMAANDLSLIADDGLHPSGMMYAEWVKLVFPLANEIIQLQK